MVMRAPQTAARKGIEAIALGHRGFLIKKEIKKTDTPKEGWEDGTPPPHSSQGFHWKERCVASRRCGLGDLELVEITP